MQKLNGYIASLGEPSSSGKENPDFGRHSTT